MSTRHVVVVATLTIAGLMSGCDRSERADAAFAELQQRYTAAESPDEWLPRAVAFLDEHPGSEPAPQVATAVLRVLAGERGEDQRAYDTVRPVFDRTPDPAARFELGLELAPVAHRIGKVVDLHVVADILESVRPLTFAERVDLMATGSQVETWALVVRQAEQARRQATREAVLADRAGASLSPEGVDQTVDRRRGVALMYQAWATAHLGRIDEAMVLFARADGVMPRTYLGVAREGLPVLRGLAMVSAGRAETALQVLTPAALFGPERDRALAALGQAWQAAGREPDALDGWLAARRLELAPPLDDVTLPDADGELRSVAALQGDSVMLLTFWFPT